mgnify:CR=1 FL=1
MQDIIKEVKCPQCANIYECRSYVLKSGENKFGKIGDVKDSIVKNCIKKTVHDGKIYIVAQCPVCKSRKELIIPEEK